jgi:hypothetical protein
MDVPWSVVERLAGRVFLPIAAILWSRMSTDVGSVGPESSVPRSAAPFSVLAAASL